MFTKIRCGQLSWTDVIFVIFVKAEQIHKTTTIFTQNDKFFAALSENDFQFVEFAKL